MKQFLLLSLAGLMSGTLFSQLTVTGEDDDMTFIYALSGPGVTVSDIVRNCADGASGFFNSMDANVGIDSGMILTSGSITNAMGPNNYGSVSMANGTDGDEDLTAAAGFSTYDGCVIEFDMTVMADTLRLNYVFGSEEYLEFAGSAFNDIFAFWLSGPGIPDPVNIALVPGTDLPVAINNVNEMTNPDYYVNNGDGYLEPYYSDDYYIQYDGFTVVLEAYSLVTAGETYHMKIAIADAGDGIYDSGVFLETGSLGSLRLAHETLVDFGSDYAIEKCASGYFKFVNEVPSAEPLVIDYMIAGSATNGVDYELIPEQLTIPAGESEGTIAITPLHDAVFESLESVVLYLYNPQSGFIYDTVSLLINDEIELEEFAATTEDMTVTFNDVSGFATAWEWDFGDGATSTEQNPAHTYTAAGDYEVCLTITNDMGCTDEYCKTVFIGTVGIDDLDANIIVVSPNPVQDIFSVTLPSTITGDLSLSVKNIMGQTVISLNMSDNSATVDMSDMADGIYFVEITDGKRTYVTQIEKQ